MFRFKVNTYNELHRLLIFFVNQKDPLNVVHVNTERVKNHVIRYNNFISY